MKQRINLTKREQDPDLWELSMARFLYRYNHRFDNKDRPYDAIEFLNDLYQNDLNYLDLESLSVITEAMLEYIYNYDETVKSYEQSNTSYK